MKITKLFCFAAWSAVWAVAALEPGEVFGGDHVLASDLTPQPARLTEDTNATGVQAEGLSGFSNSKQTHGTNSSGVKPASHFLGLSKNGLPFSVVPGLDVLNRQLANVVALQDRLIPDVGNEVGVNALAVDGHQQGNQVPALGVGFQVVHCSILQSKGKGVRCGVGLDSNLVGQPIEFFHSQVGHYRVPEQPDIVGGSFVAAGRRYLQVGGDDGEGLVAHVLGKGLDCFSVHRRVSSSGVGLRCNHDISISAPL